VPSKPSALQQEIRQRRPFQSTAHEAGLGLLRTADLVARRVAAAIEPGGVTAQQFNVLRILRGAGADGLPTLEIGERMIEQTPGITRLLDRLEAKALVRRERCPRDRRQVLCWITPAGLDLLASLDAPVRAATRAALSALTEREQRTLIDLLDRLRHGAEPSTDRP
jgi:DNA-binding MarR family transcriptional regulator